MSETFFISDTHFGHKNILTSEPIARPFNTVEEMNEQLVTNWNKVVHKHDKVYHLGDFAMGSQNVNIAGRLNGNKYLILGNHDTAPVNNYLKHFLKLQGSLWINDFLCTHIPVALCSLSSVKGNIHGHLHSKRVMKTIEYMDEDECEYTKRDVIDGRYLNVSVEQIDLTPISFEDLMIKYGY